MRGAVRTFFAAAVIALSSGAIALAQSQSQATSPACQSLVGQLNALDRGNADPTRAGQIQRAEDAVNRQQFEVDRLVSQSRRMGCGNRGLFSIFSNPSPSCGPLNERIARQRDALDQLQNQLEQLHGGTAQRASQRQALLIALANNGCGPQYGAAARAGEQGGFFDRLFGGGTIFSPQQQPSGPMGNTYRTICVRLCDGYYFPISYETTPDHFTEYQQTCQRMCPASQVQLYTFHNPGEQVSQAVSLNGQLYTELPTAFEYRKQLNANCSCRRPGESWYEALKGNSADSTVAPGDVVITNQNAKRYEQVPPAPKAAPAQAAETSKTKLPPKDMVEAPGKIDKTKRKVREVGPTFLPTH